MILGIHQSLSNFSTYLASSSLPCLQCSLWSRSQIKKNENNKTVSMKIYDRKKKKKDLKYMNACEGKDSESLLTEKQL